MPSAGFVVSVTFSTSDGSATTGVDYDAPALTVHFGEGDTTPRALEVTVLPDTLAEPDETVDVQLSDAGGCAVVGSPSSAVVTIPDDDQPVVAPQAFTVGGTVVGLVGEGLVLEDHHSLFLRITDNGPSIFADLPTPSGEAYEVRVFNQPFDPVQACTVTNGTGTFSDSNVTDVLVTCVGPDLSSPSGASGPP